MYLLFDLYLIAGKQLSLESSGIGGGVATLLAFYIVLCEEEKLNWGDLLDAILFSYVCILYASFYSNSATIWDKLYV